MFMKNKEFRRMLAFRNLRKNIKRINITSSVTVLLKQWPVRKCQIEYYNETILNYYLTF